MWGMKRAGLIVVLVGCALMSSCSWAKHRYRWVKAHLPKPTQRAQHGSKPATPAGIQPSRAQQAEARRLLLQQQEADARSKEQQYTRQLMLPEQQPGATAQPPAASRPAAALPPAAPAAAQPPVYANPYADTRFIPRDSSMMPGEPEPAYAPPPLQDAAQLRGLRSPSLPQALPMDIDGKLHSTSTR